MSNFVDNTLTDAGAALLSEVLLGAKLQPTKIVMGSGFIPSGQTSKTLTNVVTPEVTLAITKKVRVDATHVEVGGVYNNQDVTEEFYFRELALYCKAVKDDGTVLPEVMYSYGNAGNSADLMVPYTSGAAIEKQIDLITYVGNDTNVDLTISSGTYITMADLQDALKDLKAGSGIPPNDMQAFTAASTESGINLTFTGPKNSYLYGAAAADTLACVPAGVMIRYKEGGYPVDMEDGALVGDFSINPVAPESTEKEVIGLTFGNTYYFTSFPYSTEGVYNKSQADANHAMAMWSGNKGTINVNVQAYEGFEGVIGDYTITLVDQAADNPQNVEQAASGPGITQIGNLEADKTYVVTLSDTSTLMADPSEPITIVAGTSYNVDMTYRRKYGTISVNVSTASDFAELGEYTITLVHQEDGYEDVVKTATGKGVTVFDSLVDGRKYKVRLGNTPNFLPPADSSAYTIVGGENIDVNMTYSAAMGNVQINVATNPAGMPIGSYTINLIPQSGGSTLSQSGSGTKTFTFNNVPVGTYTVSGTTKNHYAFSAGAISVTGGNTVTGSALYTFNATLAQSTWEEISTISKKGQMLNFYSYGDTKPLSMKYITKTTNVNSKPQLSDITTEVELAAITWSGGRSCAAMITKETTMHISNMANGFSEGYWLGFITSGQRTNTQSPDYNYWADYFEKNYENIMPSDLVPYLVEYDFGGTYPIYHGDPSEQTTDEDWTASDVMLKIGPCKYTNTDAWVPQSEGKRKDAITKDYVPWITMDPVNLRYKYNEIDVHGMSSTGSYQTVKMVGQFYVPMVFYI